MGKEYLKRSRVAGVPAGLILDDSFSFEKFGVKFDFVFSHAVFTHLSHKQIETCLVKLKEVVKQNGVGYFTFKAGAQDIDLNSTYRMGSKHADLNYQAAVITKTYFSKVFKKLNLQWDYLGDCGHPTGQHVIKVVFAPRETRHKILRARVLRLLNNLW